MVQTVLAGRSRIETAWRKAPTANGNSFGFESVRSSGYVAEMDPENGDSGFRARSSSSAGSPPTDVLRNARGNASRQRRATHRPGGSSCRALPGPGWRSRRRALPRNAAGRPLWYRIPYTIADRDQLPDDLQASVRWDPLDPDAAPADPEATPDFGLVMAERVGDVVAPVGLEVSKKYLSVKVTAPAAPGRYRLTVTLHDKDGVAFDDVSQAMVAVADRPADRPARRRRRGARVGRRRPPATPTSCRSG